MSQREDYDCVQTDEISVPALLCGAYLIVGLFVCLGILRVMIWIDGKK